MDTTLEVLLVPVSDVDRAKRFYENLGFRLDIDYVANEIQSHGGERDLWKCVCGAPLRIG